MDFFLDLISTLNSVLVLCILLLISSLVISGIANKIKERSKQQKKNNAPSIVFVDLKRAAKKRREQIVNSLKKADPGAKLLSLMRQSEQYSKEQLKQNEKDYCLQLDPKDAQEEPEEPKQKPETIEVQLDEAKQESKKAATDSKATDTKDNAKAEVAPADTKDNAKAEVAPADTKDNAKADAKAEVAPADTKDNAKADAKAEAAPADTKDNAKADAKAEVAPADTKDNAKADAKAEAAPADTKEDTKTDAKTEVAPADSKENAIEDSADSEAKDKYSKPSKLSTAYTACKRPFIKFYVKHNFFGYTEADLNPNNKDNNQLQKLIDKKLGVFDGFKKRREQGEFCPRNLFVIDFVGTTQGAEHAGLRRKIDSILEVANEQDEVIVNLTSPGGLVNTYGLCASQLQRIRDRKIFLTVTVDQVAASGGYLMACVANRIVAAPFAYIGSIGVIAGIPNFRRVMDKYEVDYEQMTSGKYKRTLSVFGENTDEGRAKFQEELEAIHKRFKEQVLRYRPQLEIEKVATGESWLASDALEHGLVDKIATSDEYINERIEATEHCAFKVALQNKTKRTALTLTASCLGYALGRGLRSDKTMLEQTKDAVDQLDQPSSYFNIK